MQVPEPDALDEPIRPLKRVEFIRLAKEGFFDTEHVELLFGAVVPMTPTDPPHDESTDRLGDLIRDRLRTRARVRVQGSFAASDSSQPRPDVLVMANGGYWDDHPEHALLLVAGS